jgi:Heavy-metal resistance protein CzcE
MKSSLKIIALAAGLIGSTAVFAAGTPMYIGEAIDGATDAQRVITIKPDTKWVNVRENEVVKFVDAASGKSFVWDFDTGRDVAFDLSKVEPAILGGHHVAAYVECVTCEINN